MRLRLTLFIICIVALILRIALICNTIGTPGNFGMAIWHAEAARNIVEGRGFVADKLYIDDMVDKSNEANRFIDIEDVAPPEHETFIDVYLVAPGTACLLAFTYWAFGEYRYIYLRVLQALIDILGCLVIFLLGRELFSEKIGLISAAIYAVFMPIAYLSTMVMHDALMPLFAISSLYLLVLGIRRNSVRYYVLSAIIIGISCFFQPSFTFLPIMYGAGVFVYHINKIGIWKQILHAAKITIIMVLVVMIMITPWIIRNYQVSGILGPTTRGGSYWGGTWEGIGEFPDNPIGAVLNDVVALDVARQELGYDVVYGTKEYDAVFRPKIMNLINNYPSWCVGAVVRRIPRTIFYVNAIGIEPTCPPGRSWLDCQVNMITWADFIPAMKNGSVLNLIEKYPYITFYWGVVCIFGFLPPILAFCGATIARKKWRGIVLLLLISMYLSMVHMITFVSGAGKSLLPGVGGYIILGAVVIAYIVEAYNKKGKT